MITVTIYLLSGKSLPFETTRSKSQRMMWNAYKKRIRKIPTKIAITMNHSPLHLPMCWRVSLTPSSVSRHSVSRFIERELVGLECNRRLHCKRGTLSLELSKEWLSLVLGLSSYARLALPLPLAWERGLCDDKPAWWNIAGCEFMRRLWSNWDATDV